ncbi:MAG: hypothetical protein QE484_03240 [Rhizobium sp.]|nr:hypothetical protein [Rhizobium sp.]
MSTPKMSVSAFDDFVERQQATPDESDAFDGTRERDEWLVHLSELYALIDDFLRPYVEKGSIAIDYDDISLTEEGIGQYDVKRMVMQIGRQRVTFTPVGTMLIGTKGRVDVEGTAGRARLILTDRQARKPRIAVTVQRGTGSASASGEPTPAVDWTWKIATMPPQIEYIDLTRDSLFEMVMEVANA